MRWRHGDARRSRADEPPAEPGRAVRRRARGRGDDDARPARGERHRGRGRSRAAARTCAACTAPAAAACCSCCPRTLDEARALVADALRVSDGASAWSSTAWPRATTSCDLPTTPGGSSSSVTGDGGPRARRRGCSMSAAAPGASRTRPPSASALRAWGVDRSPAMVEQARARRRARRRLPRRLGRRAAVPRRLVRRRHDAARRARARRRAARTRFREAARVLAPGGRLFIWTFAPEHFTGFYLAPYLPSLPADRSRALPRARRCSRTSCATPASTRSSSASCGSERSVARAEAAARVRAGYISTVHLLPPARGRGGASRASSARRPQGAPDLATLLDWRLLVASADLAASTAPDSVQPAVGNERPRLPVPLKPRPESPERS